MANGLGLEPILLKRIFKMAWPVVLGMLTQSMINTIDVMMVGQLPQEYAVPGTAAIMTSLILLWAFGGSLTAIAVGNQALCARRYSQQDFLGAGSALYNAIILALVGGIFMIALAWMTLDPLLKILTPSSSVQAFSSSFCQIRLLALLAMGVTAAYKSFYDGIGSVHVHMYVAFFMNLMNVIFNFIFIYGWDFGPIHVPALYVDGAAIGSVISSYMGTAAIMMWGFRKKDRNQFQPFRLRNFNPETIWKIFTLSMWAGMATIILMLGVGLFNYVVGLVDTLNHLPDINAASNSIIINILLLVFMLSLAMGIATSTLVSQSIGANRFHLAERYCWQSARVSTFIILIVGTIAFIFPEPILRLFMPDNVGTSSDIKDMVVAASIAPFRLGAIIIAPLSTFGLIITQCLYAAGENRYVMIAEGLLHFCVFVPIAWFLAIYLDLGLMGCWISGCIYTGLMLAATFYRFQSGVWKHKRL